MPVVLATPIALHLAPAQPAEMDPSAPNLNSVMMASPTCVETAMPTAAQLGPGLPAEMEPSALNSKYATILTPMPAAHVTPIARAMVAAQLAVTAWLALSWNFAMTETTTTMTAAHPAAPIHFVAMASSTNVS